MTTDGKLYVFSTCMICLNKKNICLYCDNGYSYIEASDNSIIRWLIKQPKDSMEYIIAMKLDDKN